MAGSHSCRWCCPQGWNFHDHRQPLWIHIASFLYMYHGTVWSLHQGPQMLKWQPLDILDGVNGYDRDFTGPHPSIQRGRLHATHGIRTSHDPMVLRIWHAISHVMTPMCLNCTQRTQMCTLNSCKEGFKVKLGSNNPFGRIHIDNMIEETMNKDTHTPEGPIGSVWIQGLWANTTLPPSIGPCTWKRWGAW